MALLSVYNKGEWISDKKSVKSAAVNALEVADTTVDADTEEDEDISRFRSARQRAKDTCGLCPVCCQHHTWLRRDGFNWPSDRLVQCKKFSDMNIQQRAAAVEKAKGCSRCTAWGHQRKDCKMTPNNCGADIGGSKCNADHSNLLHGSGNVYCAAINAKSAVPTSDLFSCVKEDEDTIYYLQDIPVKGSKKSARVFWDRGSNRVLIREDYAKQHRLISKKVTYQMECVGDDEPKQMDSFIYLLDLVDMYGNVHTVWGYGVPKIMSSFAPNLSPIRKLFPHIPDSAFAALANKEVDVLIGLNMNELQPAGGIGVDRVGGLSALRSLFGCGWVIGGHHKDIQLAKSMSVATTANTLRIAKLLIKSEPLTGPELEVPVEIRKLRNKVVSFEVDVERAKLGVSSKSRVSEYKDKNHVKLGNVKRGSLSFERDMLIHRMDCEQMLSKLDRNLMVLKQYYAKLGAAA